MHINLNHLGYGFEGEPDYRIPSTPTGSAAGTIDKIETMRKRFGVGEHLHHPQDNVLVALNSMVDTKKFVRDGIGNVLADSGMDQDKLPSPVAFFVFS